MAKKKGKYPDGFCLVVDTREQSPLFLSNIPKGLVVVKDKLDHGDYSIRGFEESITIERKSIPDFYQSITRTRENFMKNLGVIRGYEWKALVIEGPEEEVLFPQEMFYNVHPNTVIASILSIQTRYNLHVYFAKNRRMAEKWILDRLIKLYNIKREDRQCG